jgi:hypothetical protein
MRPRRRGHHRRIQAAGGLEAFTDLGRGKNRATFVIQHLDPRHGSILATCSRAHQDVRFAGS